jgi:hypothetical protein
MYCIVKKRVCGFPVPSRDVTYQLSLAGNHLIISGQGEFDIPGGDGKTAILFLPCARRFSAKLDTHSISRLEKWIFRARIFNF